MKLHFYTTEQFVERWLEGSPIKAWHKDSPRRPLDAIAHIHVPASDVTFQGNGEVIIRGL